MDRLSATGYHIIAAYLCFLILFGGFIQIVTFIVLIRSNDIKTKSLTPYLINIVVSNMIMIVGSFPSTLASAVANEWAFNDVVCRFVVFLGGIAAVSMVATMTCITIEIYNTIKSRQITKYSPKNRNLKHYKVLFMIWFYSFLAMLPPLAGWTSVIKESADMNCTPNWKAEYTPDLVYVLLLTILAYILPVSIAFIYLWKINKEINQHLKTVTRFSTTEKKLQGFRNISKMAGLAIAAFTLTWLPYCVYVFISVFGGSYLIDAHTGLIAALVAKSSILYSPFIYALVNPRFRVNVMALLKIKQTSASTFQDVSTQIRLTPSLRPREDLKDECSGSFPSYFVQKDDEKNIPKQPRVLFVQSDNGEKKNTACTDV